MVHILASGVFFSGFVKDMLCLPRPLSPPLTRITMSGSAALEYGFPSTHSTNAVSVAVYSIYLLKQNTPNDSTMHSALEILAYFYACSIVLGRLYCGMHGFFDVVWGTVLGALIAAVQCLYGRDFDTWLCAGELQQVIIVVLVVLVLVRIHPEPVDDCPCFDDSVAFAGVFIGIQAGGWHFATTSYALSEPTPGTVPFSLEETGWLIAAARIFFGVLVIFAWRGIMKPLLLKTLPPIFRIIETLGLDLPRRFFTPASQYKSVPQQRNDDRIIPHAKDIPSLLSSFKRRRAISVGPQSEADAYEALAYRQKRRRDSISKLNSDNNSRYGNEELGESQQDATASIEIPSKGRARSSSIEKFRAQMGMAAEASAPPVAVASGNSVTKDAKTTQATDDQEEAELFATVQRPRVRYDVEVVTKLIVYSGIAWWAVEGNPILFHHLGLSPV